MAGSRRLRAFGLVALVLAMLLPCQAAWARRRRHRHVRRRAPPPPPSLVDHSDDIARILVDLGRQGNDGEQDVARLVEYGHQSVAPLLAAVDPAKDRSSGRRKLAAAALADLPDDRSGEAILALLAHDVTPRRLTLDQTEELAFVCGVAAYVGDHRSIAALEAAMRYPELVRVAAGAAADVAANDFGRPPRWQALFGTSH